MPTDLLPPNATPLERALAGVTARISAVPAPLAPLWDPETCPLPVLPWLAWGLSVDSWDTDWSVRAKRDAVAQSIDLHRRKGTRASIDTVIARFDAALQVVEWHEQVPRGTPHTFDVLLDIVGPGGAVLVTRRLIESIVREVTRVKPLREHFRFVQRLRATASIGLLAVARPATFQRLVCAADLPEL